MAQGVKGTGSKADTTPVGIASQARAHAPSMIRVLQGIAESEAVAPAARTAAASALLDRGLGKPAQQVSIEGKLDGMLTIVTGVPERLNGGELTLEAIEQGTEPSTAPAGTVEHSSKHEPDRAVEPATHTHTASHSLTPSPAHSSPRPTPRK